jgi:hypothetical protein
VDLLRSRLRAERCRVADFFAGAGGHNLDQEGGIRGVVVFASLRHPLVVCGMCVPFQPRQLLREMRCASSAVLPMGKRPLLSHFRSNHAVNSLFYCRA